jgi:glycosyltransferase involved in cell wall biosynthesis
MTVVAPPHEIAASRRQGTAQNLVAMTRHPGDGRRIDGQDGRQTVARTAGVESGGHEMSGPNRILWIDWNRNVRSTTLARRLGVALVEICCDGGRLWRYTRSVGRTVRTIQDQQPDVVIATNPSIVLGLLLLVLRHWYGFKLVADAHYVGVTADTHAWFVQRVLDFYNARADLVVVTNEGQARFISRLGTPAYVCQDPLPDIPKALHSGITPGDRSVLLICSFDSDEPYEAVFEAFSGLREDGFTLFVSGNYKKAGLDSSRFPWVRLLGFLTREEYCKYLRSVSVVMDLTNLEDCLVCGAYEALAAEKPLIISKTVALGEYFGDAVVLTDNTSEAIRESIRLAFAHRDELVERAKTWVACNNPYMAERIAGLRALLMASNGHDH